MRSCSASVAVPSISKGTAVMEIRNASITTKHCFDCVVVLSPAPERDGSGCGVWLLDVEGRAIAASGPGLGTGGGADATAGAAATGAVDAAAAFCS